MTINGDTAVEPDESFTINLSNVVGANVADGSATGTITNDDQVPDISIDDPELISPDGRPVLTWREGYPYDERLSRRDYDDVSGGLRLGVRGGGCSG